jgi:hypothetical protein
MMELHVGSIVVGFSLVHVFVLHHVAEIIYADAGQNPHGYSSN